MYGKFQPCISRIGGNNIFFQATYLVHNTHSIRLRLKHTRISCVAFYFMNYVNNYIETTFNCKKILYRQLHNLQTISENPVMLFVHVVCCREGGGLKSQSLDSWAFVEYLLPHRKISFLFSSNSFNENVPISLRT